MASTNFYELLGVSRNATDEQIIAAFENKIDRIRSQGLQKQEQVNEARELHIAHLTLIDPTERQKYDTFITSNPNSPQLYTFNEPLKNLPLSTIQARSNSKFDSPFQISQVIQQRASQILKNQSAEMSAVQTVMLNQMYSRQIPRHDAHFFLLCTTEDECNRGIVIDCESPNSSHFKLVLFDHTGNVRLVASSSKTFSKKTSAQLFFTQFQICQFSPSFGEVTHDNTLPKICAKIQNFVDMRYRLTVGTHLFCIYSENLISSAKYQLMSYLIDPSIPCIQSIVHNYWQIMEKKELLTELEKEYITLKSKFEETEELMKKEADETNALVMEVEQVINELEILSVKNIMPENDQPRPTSVRKNSWKAYIPNNPFRPSEGSQPNEEKKK